MKGEKLKQELFSLLAEKGAKLMGAGDLSGIVSGEMKTGVSVAVPVPGKIVRDLQTAPTKEYYDAYYALNAKLDEIVSAGKGVSGICEYHKGCQTGCVLVYAAPS